MILHISDREELSTDIGMLRLLALHIHLRPLPRESTPGNVSVSHTHTYEWCLCRTRHDRWSRWASQHPTYFGRSLRVVSVGHVRVADLKQPKA